MMWHENVASWMVCSQISCFCLFVLFGFDACVPVDLLCTIHYNFTSCVDASFYYWYSFQNNSVEFSSYFHVWQLLYALYMLRGFYLRRAASRSSRGFPPHWCSCLWWWGHHGSREVGLSWTFRFGLVLQQIMYAKCEAYTVVGWSLHLLAFCISKWWSLNSLMAIYLLQLLYM